MGRTLDLVIGPEDGICKVIRDLLPFVKEDIHHPALNINVTLLPTETESFPQNESNLAFQYNFKNADYLKLVQMIKEVNWDCVIIKNNVNESLSDFYEVINSIIEVCVPKFKFSKYRKKYPTWYSNEIKQLINEKEK